MNESVTIVIDSQVRTKRQRLERVLPAALPPLAADLDLFQQAVLNIADNAVKYTPEEGTITCHVSVTPADRIISVADSGFGISPEDQRHLFEKFFRIRSEQTKNIIGTGLGPATVKGIMEAHHGKITVQSEPGKGSVFSLVFPLSCSDLHVGALAPGP